jgi:hypothetical protein
MAGSYRKSPSIARAACRRVARNRLVRFGMCSAVAQAAVHTAVGPPGPAAFVLPARVPFAR